LGIPFLGLGQDEKKPARRNTLGYSTASAYFLTGLPAVAELPFNQSSNVFSNDITKRAEDVEAIFWMVE
jgi:hypothetical protein